VIIFVAIILLHRFLWLFVMLWWNNVTKGIW